MGPSHAVSAMMTAASKMRYFFIMVCYFDDDGTKVGAWGTKN